jgi:hypothetical protein
VRFSLTASCYLDSLAAAAVLLLSLCRRRQGLFFCLVLTGLRGVVPARSLLPISAAFSLPLAVSHPRSCFLFPLPGAPVSFLPSVESGFFLLGSARRSQPRVGFPVAFSPATAGAQRRSRFGCAPTVRSGFMLSSLALQSGFNFHFGSPLSASRSGLSCAGFVFYFSYRAKCPDFVAACRSPRDFPLQRGRAQVCPHARAASSSSSLLHPC